MKKSVYYLIIFSSIFLTSCNKSDVEGVDLGEDLTVNQSYSENVKLCSLVKKSLKMDPIALNQLNKIDCGGGSGCYDLEFIFVQIAHKLGEKNFLILISKINERDKQAILGHISIGTEFNSIGLDGHIYNHDTSIEFPLILEEIKKNN